MELSKLNVLVLYVVSSFRTTKLTDSLAWRQVFVATRRASKLTSRSVLRILTSLTDKIQSPSSNEVSKNNEDLSILYTYTRPILSSNLKSTPTSCFVNCFGWVMVTSLKASILKSFSYRSPPRGLPLGPLFLPFLASWMTLEPLLTELDLAHCVPAAKVPRVSSSVSFKPPSSSSELSDASSVSPVPSLSVADRIADRIVFLAALLLPDNEAPFFFFLRRDARLRLLLVLFILLVRFGLVLVVVEGTKPFALCSTTNVMTSPALSKIRCA
mmetsp:Transcript_39735/g.95891  ORF Transcript_39735/g.95891 Transcript_39735/m.95891 type:complete len:270 (-) Transcript_39735:1310-2119(-)